MVAPPGGAKPALGTNPIAFGFPMQGDPLVIDLGTSAFMGTDLQFRQRLGIPVPEGVAIDERGRPTTDAAAARRGALLPFGGHKGYALALAMHALGVLASGVPRRRAPDTSSSRSSPICSCRWTTIAARWRPKIIAIKATPRQAGVAEIRIPRRGAFAVRARRRINAVVNSRRRFDSRLRATSR